MAWKKARKLPKEPYSNYPFADQTPKRNMLRQKSNPNPLTETTTNKISDHKKGTKISNLKGKRITFHLKKQIGRQWETNPKSFFSPLWIWKSLREKMQRKREPCNWRKRKGIGWSWLQKIIPGHWEKLFLLLVFVPTRGSLKQEVFIFSFS